MARRQKTPIQEMLEQEVPVYAEIVADLAEAAFLGKQTHAIIEALTEATWQNMTVANLVASSRVIERAGVASGEFAEPSDEIDILPRVGFHEAITNLVQRTPMLAEPVLSGGPRYLQVQKMYQEGQAFAVADSTSMVVTEQVKEIASDALLQGTRNLDVEKLIAGVRGWAQTYAENVWRTNMNTATTAGTFGMLLDPDIAEVIPALRYTAVGGRAGDGHTRDTHAQMDGTIAPPAHRIWSERSTPAGYKCRCTLDPVDRFWLEKHGFMKSNGEVRVVIPNPGVTADRGFGRRPDVGIVQ